jgi:hypothetical protein
MIRTPGPVNAKHTQFHDISSNGASLIEQRYCLSLRFSTDRNITGDEGTNQVRE